MQKRTPQKENTQEYSGHAFEYRVADYIRQKNWQVETNAHYVDLNSHKSRETDIIAKKSYLVVDRFRGNRADILVRLYVQCKYVQPKVGLYFTEKDMEAAKRRAKDNNILRSAEDHDLQDTSTTPPWIP